MIPKQSLKEMPTFWIAIGFCLFYVLITLVYSFLPLSGKIASPLFAIGSLAVWGFGLSFLASLFSVFFWRTFRMAYVPLLISALTFAFLYYFWIAMPQTQNALLNGYRAQVWNDTGSELPWDITNVKEFDTGPSFLGDGDSELSFNLSKSDLRNWMQRTGLTWKQGPFQQPGQLLNAFKGDDNSLIYKDDADVQYAFIDRTPKDAQGYSSNTTTIFVNEKQGWVLIVDHDS